MKLLHTDGTVIPNDEPNELVEKLNNLNEARVAIADFMQREGANWALFDLPTDASPQRIKSDNPKQGITAATDLLLYGRYSHPETCAGLHLYENADLNALHHESLGMVHSSYQGNLIDRSQLSRGWNRIGLQMGIFNVRPATVEQAISKHNYVDYLIQGYPLQVWIAPIREYVASFMVQWILEGNEEARDFASNRKMAGSLKRREVRPAGQAAWHSIKSAQKVGDSVELPTEIVAPLNGENEVLDLMTLNEPTGIGLYRGGVWVTNLSFNKEDPQSVIQANKLLGGKDSKYAVKVLD